MGNAVVAVLQRVDDCHIRRLNRRHRNGFHGHDEDVFVQDVVVLHIGPQRQRHGSPSTVEEDGCARNSLHRELRGVQPFDELDQRTLSRFPLRRHDRAPTLPRGQHRKDRDRDQQRQPRSVYELGQVRGQE
jgi:hypothetical protein